MALPPGTYLNKNGRLSNTLESIFSNWAPELTYDSRTDERIIREGKKKEKHEIFPFMEREVYDLMKKSLNESLIILNPQIPWPNEEKGNYNLNKEKYEYYYNEIIRIFDSAFNQMIEKYKNLLNIPTFRTNYENIKLNIDSYEIETDEDFVSELKRLTEELLQTYRFIYEDYRMKSLKQNTNFSDEQVKSVCFYLSEKGHIRFYLQMAGKNTLLAMQTIHKFSQENNISSNDTIELFSEYLGNQFGWMGNPKYFNTDLCEAVKRSIKIYD
jgi:hypothetical protein